jgi:hypothetical protein
MWAQVLDGGMRPAIAAALLLAAATAGCGGGDHQTATGTAPAAHEPAPVTTPTAPARQPTATTNTPPPKHRKKPQPLSGEPLRVSRPYRCNGKPLKAISAAGPIEVRPAIVKPGQSFTVVVTDPTVKVALVSLAGVAPKPIQAPAITRGGHVAATLEMPGYASCGNKLLEIEGDLSAEAYVGVAR